MILHPNHPPKNVIGFSRDGFGVFFWGIRSCDNMMQLHHVGSPCFAQQLPPPKINPNRRPPKTDLILRGCYELAFSHTFSFIDLITSLKILHAYTKIIYILKELPFPSRPWCSSISKFPQGAGPYSWKLLVRCLKKTKTYILPNGGLMGFYPGTIRRITN